MSNIRQFNGFPALGGKTGILSAQDKMKGVSVCRGRFNAMPELDNSAAAPDKSVLSIALIGPDEQRRKAVASVLEGRPAIRLQEFSSFPSHLDDLPPVLEQHYDAILLDVDSDTDYAFDLAECLCASGRLYVMAYSAQSDMRLAIRFMHAGVREFFTLPLDAAEVAGALARAAHRPAPVHEAPRAAGKLFVFLGTKGGCGVTTLAANFALALAQESGSKTLLIDLGQPLGDVAINLGMATEYSVANALTQAHRLDAQFLSSLVVKHHTGLAVLAAPSEFPEEQPPQDAIDKLLAVALDSYDYVVVDAGSRADLVQTALFEQSSTIYLVTQVGISELRNANRMISQFFAARGHSLQIVLNRYKASELLFDDKQIAKALTRPVQWKVPDDYAAARRTRNTATPLVLLESGVSQVLRQMARTACGLPPQKDKKGLFGLLR